MASTVCGAVSIIQKVAPQATRCPCFNHALNLSLSKSSTVQAVRNAVGTMKEVVAFFTGSGKRNFVFSTLSDDSCRACVRHAGSKDMMM